MDAAVAYNRATYACAKSDAWEQAVAVLSAASEKGMRSYTITYNALILWLLTILLQIKPPNPLNPKP